MARSKHKEAKGDDVSPKQGTARRLSARTDWSALETDGLVRQVTFFPSIDSTNDYALRVAGGAELHGRLLVADRQTAGRGRWNRRWHGRAGRDLLFSLILRPPEPKACWHLLTLAFAAAICEALEWHLELSASVRWPNDVLIGGRKVAGILTETAREDGRRLVIGVGLNVNGEADELPPEIRGAATTLKIENGGRRVQRPRLLALILRRFNMHYETFRRRDFEALSDACRRWMGTLGRMVKAQTARETIVGVALDLEESGALSVRRESGEIVQLYGGDVVEIKPGDQVR